MWEERDSTFHDKNDTTRVLTTDKTDNEQRTTNNIRENNCDILTLKKTES